MSDVDSFMQSPLGILAFLSIFHTIGGVALGMTLRAITKEGFSVRTVFQRGFFLVWGGMFGCMPLAMGAESGWQVLLGQIGVLLVAIVVPFAAYDVIREGFRQQHIQLMAFGGLFAVIGMGGLGLLLSGQIPVLPGVVFSGVFLLVGGPLFVSGLMKVVRGEEE